MAEGEMRVMLQGADKMCLASPPSCRAVSQSSTETQVPSHLSSPQFPSGTRSGQWSFRPRAGCRRGASLRTPLTRLPGGTQEGQFRCNHEPFLSPPVMLIWEKNILPNTHKMLQTSTCCRETWGRAAAFRGWATHSSSLLLITTG